MEIGIVTGLPSGSGPPLRAPGFRETQAVPVSPVATAPDSAGSAGHPAYDGHGTNDVSPAQKRPDSPDRSGAASPNDLSPNEQALLRQLQIRDRQVRAHEAAHHAAAGGYARSGPRFEYTRGPDGRPYAVGGEVQIDTRPIAGDPEATLRKAQQIRRAALAPQAPSTQDRRIAAQASAMAQQARLELLQNSTPEPDPVDRDRPSPRPDTGSPGTTDIAATATPATCPECGGRHNPSAHSIATEQRLQSLIATTINPSQTLNFQSKMLRVTV